MARAFGVTAVGGRRRRRVVLERVQTAQFKVTVEQDGELDLGEVNKTISEVRSGALESPLTSNGQKPPARRQGNKSSPAPNAPIETKARKSTRGKRVKDVERIVSSLAVLSSLRERDVVVVGEYCRYDPRVRNVLKNWVSNISANFASKSNSHANYLVWAEPGSGKSFFITQVAAELRRNGVRFVEANLTRDGKQELTAQLDHMDGRPTLVMVDEIDAQAADWSCEVLLTYLDQNLRSDLCRVFALIGSAPGGMPALIETIRARHKGHDLLDRVPVDQRLQLPAPCVEDKAVVFAASVRKAAGDSSRTVTTIEMLALYYVLVSEELSSLRQLSDLAAAAVRRLRANDTRLHFTQLFDPADQRPLRFYEEHKRVWDQLKDLCVEI